MFIFMHICLNNLVEQYQQVHLCILYTFIYIWKMAWVLIYVWDLSLHMHRYICRFICSHVNLHMHICKCAYMFTSMIGNEPNTVETDIPPIMNIFQVYRAVNFCLHQHWMLDDGHWMPYAMLTKNVKTFVYDTHNKNENNDKRVISIAQLNLSAMLKIGPWNLSSFDPYWP